MVEVERWAISYESRLSCRVNSQFLPSLEDDFGYLELFDRTGWLIQNSTDASVRYWVYRYWYSYYLHIKHLYPQEGNFLDILLYHYYRVPYKFNHLTPDILCSRTYVQYASIIPVTSKEDISKISMILGNMWFQLFLWVTHKVNEGELWFDIYGFGPRNEFDLIDEFLGAQSFYFSDVKTIVVNRAIYENEDISRVNLYKFDYVAGTKPLFKYKDRYDIIFKSNKSLSKLSTYSFDKSAVSVDCVFPRNLAIRINFCENIEVFSQYCLREYRRAQLI